MFKKSQTFGLTIRTGLLLAAPLSVLLASSTALAEEGGASASASPSTASASLPSASSGGVSGGADHQTVVGKLGFGWFGVNGVPVGAGARSANGCGINGVPACRPVLNNSADNAQIVNAPTVGVRYWISDRLGIDAGLGFGMYSGSTKSYPYANDANSLDIEFKQDKVSYFAFALHVGVPIALSEGKHYNLQVIPEANVGLASGTSKDQAPPPPNQPGATQRATVEDLSFGGFRLDAGARVGGEIQFGFMGIPQLSLTGSVGLALSMRSVSVSTGGKTASDSSFAIATSVQQAPWALFTNNISAIYYF